MKFRNVWYIKRGNGSIIGYYRDKERAERALAAFHRDGDKKAKLLYDF